MGNKRLIILDNSLTQDFCPAVDFYFNNKNNIFDIFKKLLKQLCYFFINGFIIFQKNGIPHNPKKIIVATGGNLGGTLISLPLIQSVKIKWPDAHIVILSNRPIGLEVTKFAGLGDSFFLVPEVSFFRSFFNEKVKLFKKELLLLNAEVFISNHDFTLNYLIPLNGVKCRIGNSGISPNGNDLSTDSFLFNHLVKCNYGKNWLESYSDITNSFGIKLFSKPFLAVEKELKKIMNSNLQNRGWNGKTILIGIQASVWENQLFKAWPIHKMASLVNSLWIDYKIHCAVIGTTDQTSLINALNQFYPDIPFINCIDTFTFSELSGLVSNCNAIVANDSGLMHLSVSLDIPTLAIYGMTDPEITWIYGSKQNCHIIRRQNCKPCYSFSNLYETCKNKDCLNNIGVDIVLTNLIEILK